MLRRARIACYKSKVRLQKQKHNLEQELANCKSKLLEISNETLERLSREANLPEAQKLVLKECVAAGKARSKTVEDTQMTGSCSAFSSILGHLEDTDS